MTTKSQCSKVTGGLELHRNNALKQSLIGNSGTYGGSPEPGTAEGIAEYKHTADTYGLTQRCTKAVLINQRLLAHSAYDAVAQAAANPQAS